MKNIKLYRCSLHDDVKNDLELFDCKYIVAIKGGALSLRKDPFRRDRFYEEWEEQEIQLCSYGGNFAKPEGYKCPYQKELDVDFPDEEETGEPPPEDKVS